MSSNASNVFFAAVSWSVAQRGGGLRDISKRLEGNYVCVGGFGGKRGVRSVENEECGKCGVWKMRSVENE